MQIVYSTVLPANHVSRTITVIGKILTPRSVLPLFMINGVGNNDYSAHHHSCK